MVLLGIAATASLATATAASAGYDFPFSNFNTADNSQLRHSFACNVGGEVAISGGVLSGGTYADGTYVSESTPGTTGGGPKQGWTGQVDNYPGGAVGNTAYVMLTCAKHAKGDYERRRENDGVKVPDNHLGGATLMCGPGETVVGGGMTPRRTPPSPTRPT